jgi:hypothetical protein
MHRGREAVTICILVQICVNPDMFEIGVNGLGWVLAGLFAALFIALVIVIALRMRK